MQRTVLSVFGGNNIWRSNHELALLCLSRYTLSKTRHARHPCWMRAHVITLTSNLKTWCAGGGWGVLTGLLVPVAFRNKCERVTGPKPEPFQSIFPGVNATRTSGTGLERDRNANRNRCEQGLTKKSVLIMNRHQQTTHGGAKCPADWS